MNNFKRVLTVMLTAGFILNSFTGCGNKKVETDAISIDPNTGAFVPKKDLKITVWTTQGSDYVPTQKPKEDIVEKWLVEKTKVKVENVFGNGGGQWESVLARLIAGNNFPELMHCGAGQGATHFAKVAQADQIWELTPELLQKYAPDIWKKVPQNMWERIKVDGKIYGIPYNFPVSKDVDPTLDDKEVELWASANSLPYNVGTSLWIRDDILKMLYPKAMNFNEATELINSRNGIIGDDLCDVPINSTDEFVKLLRDIKALNLKVGNKPVYAFGYAGADAWVPYARFGPELMGYREHNYTSSWDPINQRVRMPLLEPIVKKGALLQNRLIRESVIDPESLVHTDAQCKEKVLNGQYAIAVLSALGHPPLINAELNAAGKPFRYRPLFTTVPPAPGYELCKEPVLWGGAVGILKKVSSQDIPQILNWMNTQFTDQYEETRYWGPNEAGLYDDLADGKRKFKDERFNQCYIEHVNGSLPQEDNLGLNNENEGLFSIKFMNQSKWDPMYYNGVRKYELHPDGGAKFSVNGPHWVKPIIAPPAQAWSPEFAGLELVKKYWSSRSQWEDPFKLVLVSKTDEEFEEKWTAAEKNLRSIVDVDTMLDQMTEIARQQNIK